MSKATELADWMKCETRGPWTRNSMKEAASEMRAKERRARNAYLKPYMNDPCQFIADAYGEAAAVFEARLAALSGGN